MMSCYFYTDILLQGVGTHIFNYEKLSRVTAIYEKRVLQYKRKYNIQFSHNKKEKNKINIGFLGMSLNKEELAPLIRGFIKHHDTSAFNIAYYDCGVSTELNELLLTELHPQVSLKRLFVQNPTDRMKDAVEFSKTIHQDNIDVLIYLDWLNNPIGEAIVSFKPSPTIIKLDLSGLPSASKSIDYRIDFEAALAKSDLKSPDNLIEMPLAFPEISSLYPQKTHSTLGFSKDSIILYACHELKYLLQPGFLKALQSILAANPNVKLTYSCPHHGHFFLKAFDGLQCSSQVQYLGAGIPPEEKFANVERCDIFLSTFPVPNAQEVYYAKLLAKPLVVKQATTKDIPSMNIAAVLTGVEDCIAQTDQH
jgi:hypothetical protein